MKVMVIPIIVVMVAIVTKGFEKKMKEVEIKGRVKNI